MADVHLHVPWYCHRHCGISWYHNRFHHIFSAKPPPPVEHIAGFCPPDMQPYGDSCYYAPDSYIHMEWFTARTQCQTVFGADLASIHNKDENEFIRQMVVSQRGLTTAWLGLERSATGNYNIALNAGGGGGGGVAT